MCVIIVCPRGIKTPSKRELQAACTYNPHGCGFVSERHYYKGMDFERFYQELQKRDIEENLMIHFRYATHGTKKVSNCHPFYKGGVYFMHNGVLPIISENDKTDSQICFERYIYPVLKKYGLDSQELKEVCDYWCDGYSKFAIMQDNNIRLFGRFVNIDGCLYSNTRHLDFMYRYNWR